MASLHFIMQGKGGVGKSLIATTLAQYFTEKGRSPLCIDVDPVNATFASYKALRVQRINIMEGEDINPRRFDDMVQLLASAKTDAVIDNGASSFIQLASYIHNNNVSDVFKLIGHKLVIHTVIAGGQAISDTVNGFKALAAQVEPETSFVVWLNPFAGQLELDGITFENSKAYQAHKERVQAIVKLPKLSEQTFGLDYANMQRDGLTFAETIASSELSIMTRSRLGMIRKELFDQLDVSGL